MATSSVGPSALVCWWTVWLRISVHLVNTDGTYKDDEDVPYQADYGQRFSKHNLIAFSSSEALIGITLNVSKSTSSQLCVLYTVYFTRVRHIRHNY